MVLFSLLIAAAFGSLWLLILDPITIMLRTLAEAAWPALDQAVTRKLLARQAVSPRAALVSDAALTSREREMLGLLGQGLSNLTIAQTLGLSELTVRTHVSNILGKLNLDNRTQAALYALRHGLAKLTS